MVQKSVHDPIQTLDDDLLERRALAKVILQKLNGDDCPSTLGIYGSWGTGKSSLLNLICKYNALEETKPTKPLCIEIIDAWQYEVVGNLFIPIVKRLQELAKRFGALGADIDAKTYLQRVMIVTGLAALNRFGDVSPGDLEKYRKIATDTTSTVAIQDWDELVDEIDCTRQAFAKLVENARGQRYARLIFCIDNLDRCRPDRVIHLFESIQNFLAVPGCVWVFAIDSEIVASYIQQKYQGTAMDGYSYLDKIISEQYHIPAPSLRLGSEKLSKLIDNASGVKISVLPSKWQNYAQIPRIMVPRRLIKAARKYQEVYTNPELPITPGDPDITFSLILLYQGWQDFYERLSSDTARHVGGILANFEITKGYLSKPYPKVPIPLAYSQENLDLTHYLRQAFLDESIAPDLVIKQITADLRVLRQVGLP